MVAVDLPTPSKVVTVEPGTLPYEVGTKSAADGAAELR
jgi:hypothetical protein